MSAENENKVHEDLKNTVDLVDDADMGPTFAGIMKVVFGTVKTLTDLSGIEEAKICRLMAATMLLHATRLEDGDAEGIMSGDKDEIGECDGSA